MMLHRLWISVVCCVVVLENLAHCNESPIFQYDMNNLVVVENTPVGEVIAKLEGFDPEGSAVHYGIEGTDRLSVNRDTGDVKIEKPLDREVNDTLRFLVTLEDEVDASSGGMNNVVKVPVSIIIDDQNDNAPVFKFVPYEISVTEDAEIGSTVLSNIKAEDVDLIGDSLEVSCKTFMEYPDSCDKFEVIMWNSSEKHYEGGLVLSGSLDYNEKSSYQLLLLVTDGQHNSSTLVTVRVVDVQNTPPVFQGSLTAVVQEDAPIGSHVMTLRAKDGDRGNPRNIIYDLAINPQNYFSLDSTTGELRIAKQLDREKLIDTNGVVSLMVRAREIANDVALSDENSSALAVVSVTIRDVNDEPPVFNQLEYHVAIPENLLPGSPLPNLNMTVTDSDVGDNSEFKLKLDDVSGVFSVEPETAVGFTSVIIKLANGTLDYENPNQRKFIVLVIAEETETSAHLSSTATVNIDVTDVNDNPPTFEDTAYMATVSETALPGTTVIALKAMDRDSGHNGQTSIAYELLGEGVERFNIDKKSGLISVALCPSPGTAPCLDYETKSVYFFTFKATDNEGKGHSTSVPLKIVILDSNDNPPVFELEKYVIAVDEGATKFETPFFVQAYDADKTSEITYFIQEEEIRNMVAIDSESGEISIISPEGFKRTDDVDSISFTVVASDGVYSGIATVIVDILDVNDNAPVFSQKVYSAIVPEDVTPGQVISRVGAADADYGVNSELVYRIEKGSFNDFAINSTTGDIYVVSDLDYDERKYYNMTIVAEDGGVPSLTGSATVLIKIINVNNKNPFFTPILQKAEVKKDAEVGTVFYKMSAVDPDLNDTSVLNFMFTDTIMAVDRYGKEVKDMREDFEDFFGINMTTGEVYVNAPLSRDVACVVHLGVVVTDTSASNPQHGEGTLVVTILEVNDIPPVFVSPWSKESPYYVMKMEEEQPIGTVLGTFIATDENSEIDHYEISPESEYFYVDRRTGTVEIKKKIDFEEIESVNFTLLAFDIGEPQLSATAYVIVNIINVNDMSPIFDKVEYYAKIKENSPKGTPVIKVKATDGDSGDYGIVHYELQGEHSEDFSINENTGQISVVNPSVLDREITSQISVKVVATDGATGSEMRSSAVSVNIQIEDVNDNKPKFTVNPYVATLVETIPYSPPSPILQLHAEDKDENAQLQYRILNGNENDVFYLDSKTGILSPKRSLVGNKKQITLEVEVSDGIFSNTAKIELAILDVNQYKPVFKQPSVSNSTVHVSEDSEINHLVMIVYAEDKDPGENGRVTYHFRVGDNDTQTTDQFIIKEDTGELRTASVLDREQESSYQLILVARDHGTQVSYETVQFLTVKLTDVNDNLPSFRSTNHYIYNVAENGEPNRTIGKLEAEDLDEGQNAKIYFYIMKGNENNTFVVNHHNGSVAINWTLDRESKSEYTFYVKISNDANYNISLNETISVNDTTVAKIVVHVEDENDNPPVFKQPVYYAGVNSISGIGEFITQVEATDLDKGENAALHYEIGASYLYKAGLNYTSGSIVPSPFAVNSQGKIQTAAFVAEYNQDRFQLHMIAREKVAPYRETKAIINIWVYELQQLVRIVFSRPPKEVVSIMREIVSELSNITNSVIVVDDIRYHIDTTGKIKHNWCDMYMHMVDNETQTIVTIPSVLKVIDDRYDFLKDYYAGFAIENVLPAYVDAVEEPFEPALAALVALLIVLCIGGISIVVVCFCFGQWIAAKPLDMKCDMLMKKPIIDDLSTTENPLWIEQKLKLYEEQELTMQVFCEPEASRMPYNATLERRGSDRMSVVDNTYATIQHPARRSSMNTVLSMNAGDYATLGGSILPVDTATSPNQQMIEAALGFQGCTFQVPEAPPDTAELLRSRSELRLNKEGQPEFISELT